MGQCCTVMAMTILAGKSGTESFLPPEEFSRLRDGGTQGGEGVVDVDSWRKSSAVIVAPPAPPVILVEITVPRYEYFKFCVSLAHDQIGSSPDFGGRLIGGFGG